MKTKRLLKNATLCALVMVLGGSLFMTPLFADSYDSFSVTPNIPDNQVNKNAEYFDLLLTENQEQTITIDIENKGNEDMVAYVELNNGTTGDNASKQYMVNKEPDVSMKHPLTTLATVESNEIEIKAGETKQASIALKAPQQAFDGVVLGGVRIYAHTKEDKPATTTESINIENQLNYMVAIQLHMNDNPVDRNLNLLKVGTKLTSYQPTVTATVQNDQAILMNGVSIEGTIKQKGSTTVIGTVNQDNRGIMPNTNFDVVYDLNTKTMKSGDYDVYLKITHEEKVWEWTEDLTISDDDASDLNDQAIFDKNGTNWWMIAAISLLSIVFVLLFFILFKRRKKEKEEENEK